MLFSVIFGVFFLAVCTAGGSTQHPHAAPNYKPNCRGLHGPKNYPNPKQLNTYFQCVYGRPVKLWCPSRQLFNAAKGTCLPIKDIDEYPDVDRSEIKCSFEGEYHCNPLNPHSFYQCSHGVPYLHDCPAGLVFNKVINVCDYWAPIDGCGFKDCPEGQEYDPDSMSCVPIVEDPCRKERLPNGYYPDYDTDCEFYFKCHGGSQDGDVRKCPDDHRFDPRTMECERDLSIVCAPCGIKQC